MARYGVTWRLDSASAVQRDIFTVTAGANRTCRILRASLSKSGDVSSEGAAWLMGFSAASGSVSTGTLGGPRNRRNANGGTHQFTVGVGFTTLATIADADDLWREGFNLAVGGLWQASDKEEWELAAGSTIVWVMRMTVVPAVRNLRASLVIEED